MASRLSSIASAFARNPGVGRAATKAAPPKGLTAPPKGLTAPPPKGLPAVSAPAAGPVAPAAAPLPWDANYETRVGGINRDRDSSLAGLLKEETDVKQAYGFDDLSNPFSKLALLRESLANATRGNTNSMAAAGQLHSGALVSAQADTQHGYDQSYDATRRAYDTDLGDIAARRTRVTSGAEDSISGAGWDRTMAALQNRPDPASIPVPAAPAAPTTSRPANFAALKKAWNANKSHTVSWEEHARRQGWM